MGKGGGHSPPSPLSPGGRFPRFTGVPLAGTGRRRNACPWRGGYPVAYSGAGRNSVKEPRPRRRKYTSRNRPLSARLWRWDFIHRRRMRSQRSRPRKRSPQPGNTDAPFARWLLRSSCHPRGGSRWGRPPLRCVTRPFRHAYRPGLPWPRQGPRGTFPGPCVPPWCPGAITTHRVGPRHRPVWGAAGGRGPALLGEASAGWGAWPTDPAET